MPTQKLRKMRTFSPDALPLFDSVWTNSFTQKTKTSGNSEQPFSNLAQKPASLSIHFTPADSNPIFYSFGISADEAVAKINQYRTNQTQLLSMSARYPKCRRALFSKKENGFCRRRCLILLDTVSPQSWNLEYISGNFGSMLLSYSDDQKGQLRSPRMSKQQHFLNQYGRKQGIIMKPS